MARAVVVPLALAVLAGASHVASQQADTSERAVVSAGAAYVAGYQRQLTSIVADEIYTQQIAAQLPREPNAARTRQLRSEVFFMFAPATGEWMAIRDVLEADEQPPATRLDIVEALQRLPPAEVGRAFREHNARYNVGRTFRNFNEPTLALLVLDERHRGRFSFDRTRVEQRDGSVVVTLSFREREPPTLIRGVERGRVFSRGELVVEAGTGRTRRTVIGGTIGSLRFELTTEYARDERLGLWVPTVFREEYEHGTRPGTSERPGRRRPDYERIMCEARYTNYRRFETSVRIK